MIAQDFNTLIELFETFPTEQSCIDHLEHLRWSGVIISPFDSTSIVYKCKDNKYRCKNTGKYFNVRTKTLFDNTKIPLRKWFAAIWLVTCHKRGISSTQLSTDIGVTQKTAWFMLHRIRKVFGISNDDDNTTLENEVEIDETFVGGKPRKKNKHKDDDDNSNNGNGKNEAPNKRGRGTSKRAVIGVKERSTGKVHAVVANYNKDGKQLSGKQLFNVLKKVCKGGNTVMSDQFSGYNVLDKENSCSLCKAKSRPLCSLFSR